MLCDLSLVALLALAFLAGIVFVCAAVSVHRCWRDGTSHSAGHAPPAISGFTAELSPGQQRTVIDLVERVAPLVRNRSFDKTAIEGMLSDSTHLDAVMYFHFRNLLAAGTLSVPRLSAAIAGTYA